MHGRFPRCVCWPLAALDHDVALNTNGYMFIGYFGRRSKHCNRADLMLYGPFGPHSSTMYRRANFSLRYLNFDIIDWLLSVDLIGDGYGLMLDDVLAAYRLNPHGMSTGATANLKTRTLLAKAQLHLIVRFPEYRSTVALRSTFLTLLDIIKLKRYFVLSLKVLFKTKSIPKFMLTRKLISFYMFSKLPRIPK